jgi:hypothetical protein
VKETRKQEEKGRSRARPAVQTMLANCTSFAASECREQFLAGIIASAMNAIIAIDERHEITLVAASGSTKRRAGRSHANV